MKLDLMFTGSEDSLGRCRYPRREVMDLVSEMVGAKRYGTTVEFLGVNVVIQDAGTFQLRTNLSRKNKYIGVDVELNARWVKNASDIDIMLALLNCIIEAAKITCRRLTRKGDDFDAKQLINDLQTVAERLRRRSG